MVETERSSASFVARGRRVSCAQPLLMGVLNVTPDSFSDGGAYVRVEQALARAHALIKAGAQIIDIGGESTRPGALPVPAAVELARVVPAIEALAGEAGETLLSVDTSKAEVAAAALAAGAQMVNDVTALSDAAMAEVVADYNAALVLMHMRGEPRTMQSGEIVYADLLAEITAALGVAVERARAAGVARENLLIDPGIGFGKTVTHNLSLTKHLDHFAQLGLPIVYGPSRKRFLGELTGRLSDDRDRATAAACCAAVLAGASILRVHDVAAVADAVRVATALRDAP